MKVRFWNWLGIAIWALAAGVLASQLTVPWGTFMAVVGAILGVFAGRYAADSKLRLPIIWALGATAMAVVWSLAAFMRDTEMVASLLGPPTAYALSEGLLWLSLMLALVTVLRATSQRMPALLALELGVGGLIFASIFAAHREGFINRPYFLIDPIWAKGYDPLPAFLAIGAVIAALMLVFTVTQRSNRQSLIDLGVLLGIILLIFVMLPVQKLKDLQSMRSKASQSHKKDGDWPRADRRRGDSKGKEGQSQGGDWKDLEFVDEPSSSSNPPVAVVLLHGEYDPPAGFYYFRQTAFSQYNGQRLVRDTTGKADRDVADYFPTDRLVMGNVVPDPDAYVLTINGTPTEGSFRLSSGGRSTGNIPYDASADGVQWSLNSLPSINGIAKVSGSAGGPYKIVFHSPLQMPVTYDLSADGGSLKGGKSPSITLVHDVRPQPPNPYDFQTLNTTVALLTEHSRPFGLIDPATFEPVANPDPKRFQRAYDVTSVVMTKNLGQMLGHQAGDPAWDDAMRRHYLDAPTDPRYKEMADKILDILKPELRNDPLARAAAVKYWLDKHGTYSLDSRHEFSSDPVAEFLFGDMTGYCVFFAHAATFLNRTLGVPSRVGTGYMVNARNRSGGSSLLIRGRDSHAWPEVYLQGVGWVVVDIAPEKSIVPPEDPPDHDMQQMMGDMARKTPTNPKEDQHPVAHGDLQQAARDLLALLYKALGPMLVLFVIAMYVVKVWRRCVPYFCPESTLPVFAYRATLDEMADAGRVRRYGQTREDFARKTSPEVPTLARLTALHQEATLGKGLDRHPRNYYLDLYKAAAAELRRSVPWLRRLGGLIDPFSWWRVK